MGRSKEKGIRARAREQQGNMISGKEYSKPLEQKILHLSVLIRTAEYLSSKYAGCLSSKYA